MLLENGAGPTSVTFCFQIIIEFTNHLCYGHHEAKESEVDQDKHSEEQYLGEKTMNVHNIQDLKPLGLERQKGGS
jgi:hypothetical protein